MPAELLPGLELGASVAHNGCCLTVTAVEGNRVSFDLIKETLRLTNLGDLALGDIVNIERAAKFNDEIGGHFDVRPYYLHGGSGQDLYVRK